VLVSVSHRNSLGWIKYSPEIAAEKRIGDRKDAITSARSLSPAEHHTSRFRRLAGRLKKVLAYPIDLVEIQIISIQ
jgi:hypothetical protein